MGKREKEENKIHFGLTQEVELGNREKVSRSIPGSSWFTVEVALSKTLNP